LVESKDFGTLIVPIVVFVLSATDPNVLDEVSLGWAEEPASASRDIKEVNPPAYREIIQLVTQY